ncbi:MAG: acyl-ACP--UDP-N-acetylglucosamine O-acyltransferase [Candidatus Eisenbacteria bacterium]|nr:acyl-ACP--UDP-N-acetylglucosamine O-acyltransferase [Candidatus Eisenbacteria bacterium]
MAAPNIHPTAIVASGAELDPGVDIGPFAIIGRHVHLGPDVSVGAHAIVEGHTRVGAGCRIFPHAAVGLAPQDLKYRGEVTWLHIGERTVIREFATLNLATDEGKSTRVGSDCLLMAYTHVAHNCTIGNHVILANAVNLAGHVTIEDYAILGGMTPIHQFVRIGAHVMIGGASRISQDVTPYALVAGNPPAMAGLNRIGLERRGFTEATIAALKRAYKILFRSELLLNDAIARIRLDVPSGPEVGYLLEFVESSQRGLTR